MLVTPVTLLNDSEGNIVGGSFYESDLIVMTRIIISTSSKTATSVNNSEIRHSIPIVELGESASLRLVKAIIVNAAGGNYAVLCDSVAPSILNNTSIPCLGIFSCPVAEKTFETESFEPVLLTARTLSNLRLSLFDIDKRIPAEPIKGRKIGVVYVIEITK